MPRHCSIQRRPRLCVGEGVLHRPCLLHAMRGNAFGGHSFLGNTPAHTAGLLLCCLQDTSGLLHQPPPPLPPPCCLPPICWPTSAPPRPLTALQGVTDASRKPLTAADGAARVLHPLLAWASGRLPDDQLAHVLVWKDFLPLRVLPAAKALLAGLRMHPLAATLREGPRQPAAAARSGSAGPASVGRLEVVQVAEGQHKVSWGPPECMCDVLSAEALVPCKLHAGLPPGVHEAALAGSKGGCGRHSSTLLCRPPLCPRSRRCAWWWAAACVMWGPSSRRWRRWCATSLQVGWRTELWWIWRRMTRITCNPAGFHGHCNAHPHCCCTALVVLMPNLGACLLRGDILQEQQQTRC